MVIRTNFQMKRRTGFREEGAEAMVGVLLLALLRQVAIGLRAIIVSNLLKC